MQKTDQNSQNFQKKSTGLKGSLALRVLLVSFVFIVVPLIFYSYVIYDREYHDRLKEVFSSLNILEDDHIQYVQQLQHFELDYLRSVRDIIQLREQTPGEFTDQELAPIFVQFAQNQNITALYYLKQMENGKLVCVHSTLPEYLHLNFTNYFSIKDRLEDFDNVYIDSDPIFGNSLVVYSIVRGAAPDGSDVKGVLCASVALDQLIEELSRFKSTYITDVSILTNDKTVLASTDPDLVRLHFEINPGKKPKQKELALEVAREMTPSPDQSVLLQKMQRVTSAGFSFYFLKKKHYAILAKIPRTDKYLMISVPSSELLIQFNQYLWKLTTFLVFILVVGSLASYILSLRMTRPLKQLLHVMKDVGHGHFDEEYKNDSLGFEINVLGSSFNQMRGDLKNYIKEIQHERSIKEAYLKELQIAHDIQESILPTKQPVFPMADTSIYFSPAKEVAGDFYDWIVDEENKNILVTVADGSGKGTMACLYAFDLRSLIRAFHRRGETLENVVIHTNQLFCEDTKDTGSFVTAFVAKYMYQERRLEYVNCGHNPPIIKRVNGTIERLSEKTMAFGVDESLKASKQEVMLDVGDVIFFFTDGITDAQDENEVLFSDERLVAFIKQNDHDTAKMWLNAIVAEVNSFAKNRQQYDDMTLFILKITS